MYKLLIVDDEDIEREGMINLIPWERYDIELVGAAWNGVEGIDKIQQVKPDIVLTDIKMPVMNGLDMIRKARVDFPDVEFVVLSGYGEFEFTSQAMEEGVHHYILKPCDEQKIAFVLEKAKVDVEKRKAKNKMENNYQHTVQKLLPRAKEQLFRNMLLKREQLKVDYQLLLQEIGNEQDVIVLAFRILKGFDYLEQFVIENILEDLLGKDNVFLTTSIEKDVLILLDADVTGNIESAVNRTRKEFLKFETLPVQVAVSRTGNICNVCNLYEQIQGLFIIGSIEEQTSLLYDGLFDNLKNDASLLVDYRKIREAREYGQILFEVYLAFLKMDLKKYTNQQKQEICEWILKILYGEEIATLSMKGINEFGKWYLLEQLTNTIAQKQGIGLDRDKDELRIRNILSAVYENLHNTEMSIQYLSKEILFMNEDYFGRLFQKARDEKFSTFLVNQRISLAQRLLQYNPDLKMAHLAEIVGYSPDGQYFSKAFRKITGMSPTEYRDSLKNEKSVFIK